MERLFKYSLLMGLIQISVSHCCAQVQPPVGYTVAGDVQVPNTYAIASGQRVTVNGLLQAIGEAQPEGNAIIFRGNPPKEIARENLTAADGFRSSTLQPGDIVVFRRIQGPPTPQRNVVLVTPAGVEVREFPAGSGVVVGQCFEGSVPGIVNVTRTDFRMTSSLQLTPRDAIQHGDIIFAGNIAGDSTGFPGLTGSGYPPVESTAPSVYGGSETASAGLPEPQLEIPVDGNVIDFNDPTEVAALDAPNLEIPVSNSVDLNSQSPFRTASMEKTALTPAAIPSVDTAAATVSGDDDSRSASFWNALFLLGLLLAAGLILIGFIKNYNEQQANEEKERLRRSRIEQPKETVQPAAIATPPKPVAAEPINSEPVGDDCPVLSAGFDFIAEEETPERFSSEELYGFPEAAEEEAIAALLSESEAAIAPENDGRLVESGEWFGTDWQGLDRDAPTADLGLEEESIDIPIIGHEEEDPDSVNDIGFDFAQQGNFEREDVSLPVVDKEEFAADDTAESEGSEAASARSDLDELIQNRLPLQLKQTDLPLKVALYGKPAGPKRLRLDSSHTQIAAPHMTLKSRPRRPKATTTQESAPSDSSSQISEGLDRALNFLDEQADG